MFCIWCLSTLRSSHAFWCILVASACVALIGDLRTVEVGDAAAQREKKKGKLMVLQNVGSLFFVFYFRFGLGRLPMLYVKPGLRLSTKCWLSGF